MQRDLEKKLNSLDELLATDGIIDIFLFGSSVKGKAFPRDIDVLLIFSDDVPPERLVDLEVDLRDKGFDAVCIHYSHLFKEKHLLTAVLFEGVSMKTKKRISEGADLISLAIFVYKHHLNSTDRGRFYRAIKSLKTSCFPGKGVIIVEVSESSVVEEILVRFGINYIKLPSVVPKSFYRAFEQRE